jgi:hypothetical protein
VRADGQPFISLELRNQFILISMLTPEGGGEFRTPRKRFAGRGIGIDARATGALQRLQLPRKVLLLRAHAGIADEPFRGLLFETHL